MATNDELRAFVKHYADTVAGRDADAYSALFSPDAVQIDPASAPPNTGRDAIRAFFEATVASARSAVFEVGDVHTCGDAVAFTFVVTVMGDDGGLSVRGIEVFDLNDAGLIRRATAWWDDADVTPVAL